MLFPNSFSAFFHDFSPFNIPHSPPAPPSFPQLEELPPKVQLSVSALVGHFLLLDRYFLHRLCSLMCFAWYFRSRYSPVQGGQGGESGGGQGGVPGGVKQGKGNGGIGYSTDEVKSGVKLDFFLLFGEFWSSMFWNYQISSHQFFPLFSGQFLSFFCLYSPFLLF